MPGIENAGLSCRRSEANSWGQKKRIAVLCLLKERTLALVHGPQQFEVIITNNLFDDIIAELDATLRGGLGMAASGNIHPGRTSMFAPVPGSAPVITGRNQAIPIGAIASVARMLDRLHLMIETQRIGAAIVDAVRQRKLTAAVGGHLRTAECGQWVPACIERASRLDIRKRNQA